MLAAVMPGFRWSMTQILLQKSAYGLENPITMMTHVTPVMAIATMILSLLLEPWSDFQKNSYFDNPWHVMRSCLLMLIGGSLAFFMVTSVIWFGTKLLVLIRHFMIFKFWLQVSTKYILISATSAITDDSWGSKRSCNHFGNIENTILSKSFSFIYFLALAVDLDFMNRLWRIISLVYLLFLHVLLWTMNDKQLTSLKKIRTIQMVENWVA